MSDPVEGYFTELRDIHASGAGVAETSYYGPLATLLTAMGSKLKPKVTAIINLRNTGGIGVWELGDWFLDRMPSSQLVRF